MAGTTVDNGTGASISFGTSSFNAEITGFSHSGIERASIDTTQLSTAAATGNDFGSMTFIPGDLSNPGELSLDIHWDPDTIPPIDGAAETITITFPKVPADATAANFSVSGFVTGFDYTVPLEDKMTGTVTVKLSSTVTTTAAA